MASECPLGTTKTKNHRLQGEWRMLKDCPNEVEGKDLALATKASGQLEGHSL